MPKIYDKPTGRLLGTVTTSELEFLVDQLEEESSVDQDYYIHISTLDLFAEAAAPANLVAVLRAALGDGEEAEVRWEAD
jgi:hypothetical protein